MTTHDEFATWDGAYLLGALSPADRRAYEEHLRDCDECTGSVGELAGLPGLLGRVPAEDAFALLGAAGSGSAAGTADVAAASATTTDENGLAALPPEGVGGDVLPALLRHARRRRIRTRWWAAGSLAAAAVIVALTAVVLPTVLAPAPAPQAAVSAVMTQVEPSALSADLKLVSEPWGTRIQSRCSYAAWAGSESDRSWTYAMVVTDRTGKQTQISTWSATAGSTVHPTATTSVPIDQIASIDIRSATDGTVLLKSSLAEAVG